VIAKPAQPYLYGDVNVNDKALETLVKVTVIQSLRWLCMTAALLLSEND
jgi:hypothetical protein